MAQSALRALTQQLMQGGPAPSGMASYQTAVQNAANRPQASADMLGGLSQFTSLDTPQNMSLGATVADIGMGFLPGVGTAQGMRDFERARRDDDMLGMALGGLSAFPFVGGVVKAGKGIGKAAEGALDMSRAARMQRAADEGFDERVFYHGGASDIDEFRSGKHGNYFTDDPRIADIYAKIAQTRLPIEWSNANPNVMPVRLRGPALVVSDQKDGVGGWYTDNLSKILGLDVSEIPWLKRAQVLRDEAKRQGYGFLEIQDMDDYGGMQSQFVSLDPKNIRSVNAEFNPDNRGSANLMAGVMGGAVGLSALSQQREDKRNK